MLWKIKGNSQKKKKKENAIHLPSILVVACLHWLVWLSKPQVQEMINFNAVEDSIPQLGLGPIKSKLVQPQSRNEAAIRTLLMAQNCVVTGSTKDQPITRSCAESNPNALSHYEFPSYICVCGGKAALYFNIKQIKVKIRTIRLRNGKKKLVVKTQLSWEGSHKRSAWFVARFLCKWHKKMKWKKNEAHPSRAAAQATSRGSRHSCCCR